MPDKALLFGLVGLNESSFAAVLAIPSLSGNNSVISMYSPASILETSLAGTGGSPAPMVTESSRVKIVKPALCAGSPKILSPCTVPGRGRSPTAMKEKKGGRWVSYARCLPLACGACNRGCKSNVATAKSCYIY